MARGKWLEDQAYDYILDKIETKEWLPQEHIRELEVAKELDISRTPVRNAFKRLEEERVIKIEPYKGAVILKAEVGVSGFQDRIEFLELFLVHYFHKLETQEIDFDTTDLEEKWYSLNETIHDSDSSYEKAEVQFWKAILKYSTNKYNKSLILEAIHSLLPEKGKIKKIVLSSRKAKSEHFNKIIEYLKDNNYPYVRREVRILLNQLNLNVIQGI